MVSLHGNQKVTMTLSKWGRKSPRYPVHSSNLCSSPPLPPSHIYSKRSENYSLSARHVTSPGQCRGDQRHLTTQTHGQQREGQKQSPGSSLSNATNTSGQVGTAALLSREEGLLGLHSVAREHSLGGWVGVRVLGDVSLKVDKQE